MTELTAFFKESISTLGVFYPKHYIIATFSTFGKAQEAEFALRGIGFPSDEILAIRGSGILEFFEEFRAQSGLWAGVMTVLSRGFGTEQLFADSDRQFAQADAGFLAIHSLDQASANRVQAKLTPLGPLAMHWYESGGVQSLI